MIISSGTHKTFAMLWSMAVLLAAVLTIVPAHASVSALGIYTGSGTENCGADPTESFDIVVDIDSQTGRSFSGNAVLSFASLEEVNFADFAGQIDDQGNITMGSFSGPLNAMGSFHGSLHGDRLNISYGGTGGGCVPDFTGQFTADRNGQADGESEGEALNDTLANVGSTQVNTTVVQTASVAAASVKPKGNGNGASTGLSPIAGGVRYQGSSAGDGFDYPFGVWAAYNRSDFDDDTGGTGLDGDTDSLLVGADFSPWDGTAFGVAIGYEDTDIDTFFNGGGLEVDGFSVVPYMAFYLSDYTGASFDLTSDFSFGYASLDVSTSRLVGATRARGSTDSERLFFAGNLTAGDSFGALYLSATTGFIVSREDIDGFTDSIGTVVADQRNEFGQFRIGGEAAFAWNSFEPYVNAAWLYAYDREESTVVNDDANSAQLGLGLRYYGETISGSFGYSTIVGRDNFDEDVYSVQLRADF